MDRDIYDSSSKLIVILIITAVALLILLGGGVYILKKGIDFLPITVSIK